MLYYFIAAVSTVPLVKEEPIEGEDPCAHLEDGLYPVRDVAKYVICHDHHAHLVCCPKGTIYLPLKGKCVSINTVHPGK